MPVCIIRYNRLIMIDSESGGVLIPDVYEYLRRTPLIQVQQYFAYLGIL